jgi:hypothetical protein
LLLLLLLISAVWISLNCFLPGSVLACSLFIQVGLRLLQPAGTYFESLIATTRDE